MQRWYEYCFITLFYEINIVIPCHIIGMQRLYGWFRNNTQSKFNLRQEDKASLVQNINTSCHQFKFCLVSHLLYLLKTRPADAYVNCRHDVERVLGRPALA